MAPAKKRGNRGQKNRSLKNEKLAAFIKDFDSQVKSIVEELKATVADNLKEVDRMYNIELLKLPPAIREMRWLDFFAKGGSMKALEAASTVDVDIEQITASVSQTPFKPSKKAKKGKSTSIEDSLENIPPQTVLRTRTNAKASTTKKLGTTRKTRVSAARASAANTTTKRTSQRNRATASNSKLAGSSSLGYTPIITPRIDTRAFKTPALRTPSLKEPVYTFSANGSPLGGMDELFINLPAGDGKNIRLTAEDMDLTNLKSLDKKAFDNIKLLSSRLEKLCKTLKRP